MANQIMLHSLLVVVLLSTSIYATNISNGLILEMIHRDSPKSPLYRANLTNNERMKIYIEMSTARVKSFRRSRVTSLSPNEGLIRPKLSKQDVAYLVQVGIGTFTKEFPRSRTYYLDLDTGSQLTWTQCEGCIRCFEQLGPKFPSSQSASYVPLSCNSCPPRSICQHGKCVINVGYAEGSKVSAVVAWEDFTFASQGESSHLINNVIFGCGFDMQNFYEDKIDENKISGIMGMSNGYYGFMEQTKLMFNGKFSYCLQPIFRPGSSPMYLRFGNDVVPQPIQMHATPIYKYDNEGAYYLHLQGISVDTQRLAIRPEIFEFKNDGTGGCIIDSGTAISWIITGAFDAVKGAIITFIKDHNYDNWRKMRSPPSEVPFKLCYQRYKLPNTINLPKITFHFENNADFEIDAEESFYYGKSSNGKDMVCMQFLESNFDNDNGLTYLGGAQQANKRIVYDLQNSMLHFGPADCSNEN